MELIAPVTLTVIGSGDACSSAGSGQSAYLITSAHTGILVDCGATALTGLKRLGYTSDDIDTILISHFHGDHMAGLPFILLDAARMKRTKKLTVISPPGGRRRLLDAMRLWFPGTKIPSRLDIVFLEYSGRQQLLYTDLLIESFPVKHHRSAKPHGMRIHISGVIIAYSGDTEWTETLRDLFADADLALCACTGYEERIKGHMNYLTLREKLPSVRCRQWLLTHLGEDMRARIPELEYPCAQDNQVICLLPGMPAGSAGTEA